MERLIEALNILLKYGNEKRPTCCEHDEMFFVYYTKEMISEEDFKKLDELGIFWSEEDDCFKSFHFGSC